MCAKEKEPDEQNQDPEHSNDKQRAKQLLYTSMYLSTLAALGLAIQEQNVSTMVNILSGLISLASFIGLSARIIEAIDGVTEQVPRSITFPLELIPEQFPQTIARLFEAIGIGSAIHYSIAVLLTHLDPDAHLQLSMIKAEAKLDDSYTLMTFAAIMVSYFLSSLLRQTVKDSNE